MLVQAKGAGRAPGGAAARAVTWSREEAWASQESTWRSLSPTAWTGEDGLLRLCGLTLTGFGGYSWILLAEHQGWGVMGQAGTECERDQRVWLFVPGWGCYSRSKNPAPKTRRAISKCCSRVLLSGE